MSEDDPFAEKGDFDDSDAERTVIRPNPGGRRPQASASAPGMAQPAAQTPAAALRSGGIVPLAPAGINSLVAAASSLLGLAIRIRNRAQHSDVNALRERVIGEIKTFEQAALAAGQSGQTIRIARYALCATIDDLVLNTPWGSRSTWARQTMVGTFHNETSGGERFYEVLEKMQQDPAANRDNLELMYLCLSLGFEGRLRVEQRGSTTLAKIRDSLLRIIRTHRGDADRDLSPHWRGVDLSHRPLRHRLPLWFTAIIALVVMAIAYTGFSFFLNGSSDRLAGAMVALPPNGPVGLARVVPPPPPPPPPAQPGLLERVRTFLAPEIEQGLVTVFESGAAVVVRLNNKGLFASGSDQISAEFLPTVNRIGWALQEEQGKAIVAGHSDNVPIRTVRFPSNYHLSLARAESVMRILQQALSQPDRITAEGRAENEPLASNDTAEGRAQNRRIEIILSKTGA
jgi:type VI secretion system protein ImpK